MAPGISSFHLELSRFFSRMENLARATARACCWDWLHAVEGNKNYIALNLLLLSCLFFVSFFFKSIKSYLRSFLFAPCPFCWIKVLFCLVLFLKQSSEWVGSQGNGFILSLISGKPCGFSDLC